MMYRHNSGNLIAKGPIIMTREDVRRSVGKVAEGANWKCGISKGKEILKAYKVRSILYSKCPI